MIGYTVLVRFEQLTARLVLSLLCSFHCFIKVLFSGFVKCLILLERLVDNNFEPFREFILQLALPVLTFRFIDLLKNLLEFLRVLKLLVEWVLLKFDPFD